MEENKTKKTEEKTSIGMLALMGIGFLVSGIMGAATASELPDAVKKVGKMLAGTSSEEEPSTDAPAEE